MVQGFPQQENLILRMGLLYGYSRARFIANLPTNNRQLTVASLSRYKYHFLPDSMKSCSRQGLLPRCLSSRCCRSHPPSRGRIGSPFHARRESGHSVPSFSTVDQCQRYSSLPTTETAPHTRLTTCSLQMPRQTSLSHGAAAIAIDQRWVRKRA